MGPIRRDKTKYKNKRWYVLFVRDNGRTVPVRHFKAMVWALILFGAALLTFIGMLAFLYIGLMDEKAALERIVASQEHEKAAIRKEKDFLMAQLAIAQSKLKISMPDAEETGTVVEVDGAETPIEIVKPIKIKATKSPEEKALPENEADMPAQNLKMEPAKISVDNFWACYDSDAGRVHVEFKVINVGEKKQPVSGYAYTILKDGKEEKDRWLIFPETQLFNGMPVQTRGMRFRIYNFRTMKFSVKHNDPNQYTYATIFVYRQDTGELMLERDFEINMIPACP
jgi:hypothetical protein